MKKLMMAMVLGLALSATGFAQERGGFAGHSDRAVNSHFSGQAARGARNVQGFAGNRDFRGRAAFGRGVAPGSGRGFYRSRPAYCPPVRGAVEGRRFDRSRGFDGRNGGHRGFRR